MILKVSFQFLNLDTRDDEPPHPPVKVFILMWKSSHFGEMPPLAEWLSALATH